MFAGLRNSTDDQVTRFVVLPVTQALWGLSQLMREDAPWASLFVLLAQVHTSTKAETWRGRELSGKGGGSRAEARNSPEIMKGPAYSSTWCRPFKICKDPVWRQDFDIKGCMQTVVIVGTVAKQVRR